MSEKNIPRAMPHGSFKEVFDGVWFIRGCVRMPGPVKVVFPRAMTVVRGEGDGLVIISSMRLSEAGLKELDALGKVTHVMRVAGYHGSDDLFYKERYGAELVSVKDQKYFKGFDPAKGKEYMKADRYVDVGDTLPIANAELKVITSSNPVEGFVLMQREEGRVLVAGDALQNMPSPDEYTSLVARLIMGPMGFFKACNVGRGWLGGSKPLAADVRDILNWDFDHLLPVHGHAVIGDAKERYRPAIEGKLKGAR